MHWKDRISAIFSENNWRTTPALWRIVKFLEANKKFHSSYDIANHLKEETAVDPSTIYRLLERLEKIKFVHNSMGKWIWCRHFGAAGQHHFLICSSCGNTEEILLHYQDAMTAQLKKNYNFQLQEAELILHGICRHCES